jgi:hypothetical protein
VEKAMSGLLSHDEKYDTAALLGALLAELKRSGYPHAVQLDRLVDKLLEHIEALEKAQQTTIADLVKTLSALSTKLRADGNATGLEEVDEYSDGFCDASHAAAAQVAEVMVGPVIQAALDAQVPQ